MSKIKNNQIIKKILVILVMLILAGQATGLLYDSQFQFAAKSQQDEKSGENCDEKKKDGKEYLVLSEAFQLSGPSTIASILCHTPISKSPFIRTHVTPPDA